MAKNIENPVNEEDILGLVLEFNKVPSKSLEIFAIKIKDSEKSYYIPYRYFFESVKYDKEFLSNKFIEGQLILDDQTRYTFKIKLPYKSIGNFIKEEEAKKLESIINDNYVRRKNNLLTKKESLLRKIGQHKEKYDIYQKLFQKHTDLQKLLKDKKSDQEKLKNDIKTLNEKSKTINSNILDAQKILNNLKIELSKLNQEILLKSNQIEEIEKFITESSKNFDFDSEKNSYDEYLTGYRTNQTLILDIFHKNAPNKASEIEEAKKALLNNDESAVNEKINTFNPIFK